MKPGVVSHTGRRGRARRGTDRQRRPAQPGRRKRLGIVVVAGFVSQPGVKQDRHPQSSTLAQRRAAIPMLGSALTVRPLAAGSTMNSAGLPPSCAPTINSSAGGGRINISRRQAC